MRCVKSTSGIWICISTLAIHLVESDLNLFSSSAPRDEVQSIVPLTSLHLPRSLYIIASGPFPAACVHIRNIRHTQHPQLGKHKA
ncbi:hypothetical protein CGCF413_v011412 [Colletotrichum fructicola]|nr:hypothetical protein CGCF413_v011412 [Colletotrichum fructicola]